MNNKNMTALEHGRLRQTASRAAFAHVLIVLGFIVHETFPFLHVGKSKDLYIGLI